MSKIVDAIIAGEEQAAAVEPHQRHPLDAYDTPPELAEAIVIDASSRLPLDGVLRVLEPTAGTGSFVRPLRMHLGESAKIVAVDLDPRCEGPCRRAGATVFRCDDILAVRPYAFAQADLAIGNPPFVAAEPIIRHLWSGLQDGASIVFLLAITFWAGKDRWRGANEEGDSGLYVDMPLRFIQPVTPRPYFGLDNDPKFEAAVFTWTKGWRGTTSCPGPIRWNKRGKKDRAALRTFGGGK